MKVLLVGEASGVHRNLKRGLEQLGVECLHLVQLDRPSGREFDGAFAPDWTGVSGGIARNLAPYLRIAALPRFDVINFVNTITTVVGLKAKYHDLPLLRSKARLMSYYALGCDELGLIRRNPALPYAPCASCLASGEMLGRDCEAFLNPRFERSMQLANMYMDFAACSMVEYSGVEPAFPGNFVSIQFPVDVANIPFVPAQARAPALIVHTPTRRGFKGTDVVLEAIALLGRHRQDFRFRILEGLAYGDYLREVQQADIVLDQVHSQSPGMNALEMLAAGKIVLTGATALGRSFFPFMQDLPVVDAPPQASALAQALSTLLDRREDFPMLAAEGRSYVERNHGLLKVATLFKEEWKSRL